ncbi:MAG TPA: hypothetical protein VM056_03085 [Terriglobales bacterium]|nr:hypothetical protein [Terriglobales bacterium]
MATAVLNLNQVASQWRTARRIYPIYGALLTHFDLGMEPCRELESPINRSEPEVMQRVKAWFQQMDEKVQPFQLRQLLQMSHLGTEENMRILVQRQLAYTTKTKVVRDKVDFLMVQYYAQCSPHGAHEDLSFDHFAEVLEPLVGDVSPLLPPFCAELDVLFGKLEKCTNLGELLAGKIIEQARDLKERAEDKYFSPSVLVAVARFNYLMRLGFFRLIHADLHAIRLALRGMETRGQEVCDCSKAGLSVTEPLVNLRQICHDWKKPFRAAYSAGNSFRQLVDIRTAVERALSQPPPQPAVAVAPPVNELLVATAKATAKDQTVVPVKTAMGPAAKDPIPIETNDIDSCLEQIAKQLINVAPKASPVSNVTYGSTKLLLASWEVAAFVRGGDELADALQRAVASRAVIAQAVEKKKAGETVDLHKAIGLAHEEAAQIQERIAEAKDAKNIDAAVNMAASAKRLLSVLEEAEKLQQGR